MPVAAVTRLETRALSSALGAEILGLDLRSPLPDDVYGLIVAQWHASLVILLRNQKLAEDDQIRFGEHFGPPSIGHIPTLEKRPGLALVTNVREDGKLIGILPDGEMHFHSDQCYREKPSTGTMLYAIEVPSSGGNTLFGNMYMAYDALPDEIKRRISGLKALNVYDYNASPTLRGRVASDAPQFTHPMVRTHPATKRKALYVNRLMTSEIQGLPAAESQALLAMLFDHIERPEFIYEHVWRSGDLLLWDNRCTVHARTDFDPNERRLLRRMTLNGEAVH
jgi:taurine dioxygenase